MIPFWNTRSQEIWGITNALYEPEGGGDPFFRWFQIAGEDSYSGSGTPIFSASTPSVACHYKKPGSSDPSMEASVTYFRSPSPYYPWSVDARRVYFEIEEGYPIVGEVATVPDSMVWGNFDFVDISLRCFGASSGLTVLWDQSNDAQKYWAVWATTLGVYCKPEMIDASFGYTEP
ncbi:MAG TPA: hypothetical protein ENN67_01215 [Firmicutes bacterium]|nr:hypothetical protein [Bacillota bacterium]